MKKTIKMLIWGLVATILFASCFTGCQLFGNKEEASSEETKEPLVMIENGVSKVKIVYPFESDKQASALAYSIQKKLEAKYNVKVEIEDDFDSDGAISTDDVEILIGNVKRYESALAYSDFKENRGMWLVRTDGNKLVIMANTEEGYARAEEFFEETCLKESGTTFSVAADLVGGKYLSDSPLMEKVVSSYTVVYPQSASTRVKNTANTLKNTLQLYAEENKIVKLSSDLYSTDYEILLGETKRSESKLDEDLFFYDYVIRVVGNKITVNGGSSFAIQNGVNKLISLLSYNELQDEYVYHFDTSLFNPIIYTADEFVPAWTGTISVPDWMTDFDEKLYAITNPKGRPMSMAHRGDTVTYPELSVEGFLSAAMLGADVIEMDMLMTKDNVLVLCHDLNLNRSTNVNALKGKNGLPDSVLASEWTYEQLQQLSLVDSYGNVTQYKMPSYYEILIAMHGRCFISIDPKVNTYTAEDIFEITSETDTVELSIYGMFLNGSEGRPNQTNSWSKVIEYSKAHPEMTRLAGITKKLESYMKISGHVIRSRGWIENKGGENESHSAYLKTWESGTTLVYTDNMPLMSTWIAKYQPDVIP